MASSSDSDSELWASYVGALSEISGVSGESIRRDSSIKDDLGLDSLGIVELVVVLVEQFKAKGLERALGSTDWKDLTVGEAFDLYLDHARRQPNAQKDFT